MAIYLRSSRIRFTIIQVAQGQCGINPSHVKAGFRKNYPGLPQTVPCLCGYQNRDDRSCAIPNGSLRIRNRFWSMMILVTEPGGFALFLDTYESICHNLPRLTRYFLNTMCGYPVIIVKYYSDRKCPYLHRNSDNPARIMAVRLEALSRLAGVDWAPDRQRILRTLPTEITSLLVIYVESMLLGDRAADAVFLALIQSAAQPSSVYSVGWRRLLNPNLVLPRGSVSDPC